ncbi:MAG: hypothetical protein ACRD68_04090, partial [Pyrinomonadaceae bacterium]
YMQIGKGLSRDNVQLLRRLKGRVSLLTLDIVTKSKEFNPKGIPDLIREMSIAMMPGTTIGFLEHIRR